MARIIIVGSVNLDRVWRLDRPLQSGERLFYESMEIRVGGGGFYTGEMLCRLGHEVVIVTRLADDEHGRFCRAKLDACGFDMRFVATNPGATVPTEIFLDPTGERTILRRAAVAPGALVLPEIKADAVYLNIRHIHQEIETWLTKYPLIVSQFPLLPTERRPADILIASRSDVTDESSALWNRAAALAGSRLKLLIRTGGRAPVLVRDGNHEIHVPVEQAVTQSDTTGAGDIFAGCFVDAYLAGDPPGEGVRKACGGTANVLRRRMKSTQDADFA